MYLPTMMQSARVVAPRGLFVNARTAALSISQQTRLPVLAQCQQLRHSSFLQEDSMPSSSRKSPNNGRESWFAKRRRARSTRKKISTLALDHNSAFETDARKEHEQSQRQDDGGETPTHQKMTRTQRRLLLWSVLLTMPLWGRDIVESVVPGMLGIFILLAGSIKRGVGWMRSLSKDDKR